MIVVGIDCGLTGAVAMYAVTPSATVPIVEVHDMPTLALKRNGKAKREIDRHLLADLLEHLSPTHVFVEMQTAMPGQSSTATGATMKNFGIILGVTAALKLPDTIVHPLKWKKALTVPSAKDGARARASALLPHAAHCWQRVKDHGRAEAALIALYGARSLEPRAL